MSDEATEWEATCKRNGWVAGALWRLTGDHPFTGDLCKFVEFRMVMGIMRPVVALFRNDALDGHECFVMDPKEWKRVKD
jgi:hypothetical protein